MAKKLLAGMADPAAKDELGRTPLHEAYGAHDSTSIEIESIMQPNATSEFRHVALARKVDAKRNDDLLRELVNVLVDKGGDELLENRDYAGDLVGRSAASMPARVVARSPACGAQRNS